MRFIRILACFIFSSTQAQNLIPNPSFEDPNYCEVGIPCSPAGWYSVTNIPYGYDNDLKNFFQGKHAVSFLVAFKEEVRTYWQAALLSNLEKGKSYSLHFYLYSPVKKFNPEYFGIYFSNSLFHSKKDTMLNPAQWLRINDSSFRSEKKQWQEINVVFEATSDAKYMLLGNLSPTSNRDILSNYNRNLKYIEYYIDDISLKPIQTLDKDEQKLMTKRLDSLYRSKIRHKFLPEPVTPVVVVAETLPAPVKIDTLVLGRINFRFDSYELQNTQVIRNYFEGFNVSTVGKIIVTGYTDSVGNDSYNVRLSENRAISVKKYLSDSLRIPKNFIFTEGRGKTNDQKLQENNRRVELVIYRKEQP